MFDIYTTVVQEKTEHCRHCGEHAMNEGKDYCNWCGWGIGYAHEFFQPGYRSDGVKINLKCLEGFQDCMRRGYSYYFGHKISDLV